MLMIFQHSELPMKSNQIGNWWRKKVEIKYCWKKLTTFFSSNVSIKSAWCIIKQLNLLVCCNRFAHLNIINVFFSSFDFEFLFCSALFLPMQTNACIFFHSLFLLQLKRKTESVKPIWLMRFVATHYCYYIFSHEEVYSCVCMCVHCHVISFDA